jgi:TolA-binding protein
VKRSVRVLVSLVGILAANAAFAAKSAPKTPPYDPNQPKPLDVAMKHLDQSLKKIKSKSARSLRQAYEQLEARQFDKARSFAQEAMSNAEVVDYAHWLIASASLEQARDQAEDEKFKAAGASAKVALQHFTAVLNGSPYSPFFRQAPKMIGEAQLMIGWGTSPSRQSVRAFEEAFERLGITGGWSSQLNSEEPELSVVVAALEESCKKFPDDLCGYWVTHLRERHAPGGAPRATQTYHAPDLDTAAFDDAMASYQSEKYSDAVDKFRKFFDEFPRSALRYHARYWLGRSLQEKHQYEDAKKTFDALYKDTPLSYYGMLAAAASSYPFVFGDQQISNVLPIVAENDPGISAPEAYHLKRAMNFLGEKANDLAGMELKEIKPRPSLSSPFVMYLAALNSRAGNFQSCFMMLGELFQRSYDGLDSDAVVKMIFPITQLDRIKKYAAENHLDPILVLSLIKQESAFDRHAFSGSGAAGLMQIMYFTATETVPGISRSDLLEPDHNIRVGTRYLAKLLAKFQGNISLSLAAYNAGPVAVERWIREGEKQKYKMLEFIEAIPYHETRDYVSSIIRNYYWYSKLLGTPMPQSLSYFWAPYQGLSKEIGGTDLPAPSPTPTPTASSSAVAVPQPAASPSMSPSVRPSASPSASASSAK